jgi:hypothetical protein
MKRTTLFLGLIAIVVFVSWKMKDILLQEVTQSSIPFPELRNNTMDIETADLDKDGDLDIVLAMEFKPNVILINDGSGKFSNESSARLPQVVHDSEDIALGDFDKDGDTDIVFVSEDDKVHEYYLNDGKGVFSDNSSKFPVSSIANAVDVADYDKDGDLDLIMGNDGQEFYLANDGKGNFTDETKSRMPADQTTTQDVQSADLDKDGDLDLIFGSENGNRLYLNNGKGIFSDATEKRLPLANEETRKIRLADIDKDGDLDAFVCNVDFGKQKDKANRILVNDGKGFFKEETAQRLSAVNDMHTGDVAFVDLDNDKDLDMIIANLFGGYSQVCINDGKGFFAEITDTVFPQKLMGDAISVETADWNKDGKPDIYFGFFRGGDRLFFSR